MPRSRSWFLLAAASIWFPSVAIAQFETLANLAGNFSDLGLGWGPFIPIHSEIRPARDPGARALHWYGAEFLFEIGKWDATDKTGCKIERDKPTERRITYTRVAAGTRDSVRSDSVHVFSLKETCKPPARRWVLELGVGYSETSRFAIATAEGQISGLMRETPSVGVYANYLKVRDCESSSIKRRLTACWDEYFGIHTGVTSLVDAALNTPAPSVEFSGGSPKSVQIGGLVGMANDLFPALTFFSEIAYIYRPFPRITWSQSGATAPQSARTRLDLSAWLFAVGLQVRVKDPKKG